MMDQRWKLVLQNGSIIEVPIIRQGHGWYYRPDEARTQQEIDRDTNKSFGRSNDGREAADTWLRQYLQSRFDVNDWSPVRKMDFPNSYTSHDTMNGMSRRASGMVADFFDNALGWQTLSLRITRAEQDKATIRMEWSGWNYQEWYWHHKVDNVSRNNPIRRQALATVQSTVTQSLAYDTAARFAKDPIATFNAHRDVEVEQRFPKKWTETLEWPEKVNEDPYPAAENVLVKIDQEHIFWHNRKNIEKVFVQSRREFDKLATLFDHLGVNVSFDMRMSYDRDDDSYGKTHLAGVSIDLPATRDDNNKLGHTIVLNTSGITVDCGYVADEKRWEETQKRHMADWLQGINDEPTEKQQEYEKYEYTPNV